MNILYCGDKNIIDGLIISIKSLLKHTHDELHIYVLTADIKGYNSLPISYINLLNDIIKESNTNSFIKLIDITEAVNKDFPTNNEHTMFTPYCMLRLYADLIDELPDKILYLDNDTVFLQDPKSLYDIDINNYELAGVLDYYGSHFFKKNPFKKDYLNSGVLLLNLKLIKKTKLFTKARHRCQTIKMIMPDQSALNALAKKKLILDRKYNEQKKINDDTVIRHFSTTFKLWPKITTQTIKPWDIDNLHNILKIHEFDDILDEYQEIKRRMEQ